MDKIHISLKAEEFGLFFGIPISNTLLMSFIVVVFLFILAFLVNKRIA
ncbi:MAG: hypothetical protein AAB862_02265 [Patescibacteria group bacterium]